mmetsp:Transcript_10606/g.17561  ORF Transcript_10606/g.17561 Transcript_10606/m.17561 type:complete len:243 (+) Transcript_10606:97-825(+)
MSRRTTQDDEWETTTSSRTASNNWRTPIVAGRERRPRRVTIDEEPWQSNLYSVPRPTRWTPEATMRSEPVEKTPNQLQSPEFRVNNNEVQYLNERMDRQEELMEKMMNEISLLRLELKDKEADKAERATRKAPEPCNIGANTTTTGGVPFRSNHDNRERRGHVRPERFAPPPRTESRQTLSTTTAGAQFVAEFSELIELDNGQHELLASIMNQSMGTGSRNVATTRRVREEQHSFDCNNLQD